jgi:hypothetical protein
MTEWLNLKMELRVTCHALNSVFKILNFHCHRFTDFLMLLLHNHTDEM